MKTPREILLERHGEADRKLAEIQAQMMTSISRPTVPGQSWVVFLFHKLWVELIQPLRLVWGSCAVVWLGLGVANLEMADSRGPVLAETKQDSSSAMLMAWREQEAIVTELTGPQLAPVADRPRKFVPKPQSRGECIYVIG